MSCSWVETNVASPTLSNRARSAALLAVLFFFHGIVFDELRACYLPALKKKPELSGRVTVQFTISSAGKVVDSVLQSSRLQDARVEKCVVKAFRGWEFPKPPGGDSVVVTHEFNFEAGWSGERHLGR